MRGNVSKSTVSITTEMNIPESGFAAPIVSEASGENAIRVNDSIEAPFVAMKVYGKTEQLTSTGKNMIPYTGGEPSPSPEYPQALNTIASDGNVRIDVKGKNLFNVDKFVELVKSYDSTAAEVVEDGRRCIKFTNSKLNRKDFSRCIMLDKQSQYTWSMDIKFNKKNSDTSTGECYFNIGFLYNDEIASDTSIGTAVSGVPTGNRYTANGMSSFKQFKKTSVTSAQNVPVNGIAFSYAKQATWYIDLDSIQIEEGDKVTSYEPYKSTSLTLSTLNGLPGVPVYPNANEGLPEDTFTDANGNNWICDEIDFNRGVHIKRVEEYTVDIDRVVDYGSVYIAICKAPEFALSPWSGGLWEYGGCKDSSGAYDFFDISNVDEIGEKDEFFVLITSLDENIFTQLSKEEFKARYNGSKMLLIRKEPIETPLSGDEIEAYKAMKAYKPITYISNDEGAHMEIKYIADTKNYIDNKFAELEAAIISTGGNV